MPVLTQQARISWRWVVLMALPVGVFAFVDKVSGTAMTFTLRKFIADPALISLLGSLNIAGNFLVAPLVAWKSDRWRGGWRRKPFIIIGLSLLVPALIAMPLAPNIWVLGATILLYQFAVDFGFTGPWKPLYYEVVPSGQRGRAAVVNRLASVTARLGFNFVLIGQFDDRHTMKLNHALLGHNVLALTGEQVVYFLAAALVAAVLLFVVFWVKEEPVAAPALQAPVTACGFFNDVFRPAASWRLYLLVFAGAAAAVGLAQLQPLLITEQFGYTKRALGNLHGVIILLEIGLVLPVMAWLSDRIDRLTLFRVGMVLATVQPLAYWCFVRFVAVNQIPSVTAIIAFSAFGALARTAAALSLDPLLFDLAPRNRLGALNSGFLIVRGLTTVLLMNGVGLWVKYAPQRPGPAGGYDYLSGYLYVFLCGLLGCAAAWLVAAQRRRTESAAGPQLS
ncbi:MAG: MFS transporter [Lentisphaeria bacterium]